MSCLCHRGLELTNTDSKSAFLAIELWDRLGDYTPAEILIGTFTYSLKAIYYDNIVRFGRYPIFEGRGGVRPPHPSKIDILFE
jgi:hypothetical protein